MSGGQLSGGQLSYLALGFAKIDPSVITWWVNCRGVNCRGVNCRGGGGGGGGQLLRYRNFKASFSRPCDKLNLKSVKKCRSEALIASLINRFAAYQTCEININTKRQHCELVSSQYRKTRGIVTVYKVYIIWYLKDNSNI